MTFGENLKRICNERGTNPTTLCKDLGWSTSKVSAWYNGSLPKQNAMAKMAEYLNCSVMDFFTDYDEIEPRDEDEKDILRVFRMLPRKERHEFMAIVYEYENKTELNRDTGNNSAV